MKLTLSIFIFFSLMSNVRCQENFDIIGAKKFYAELKNEVYEGNEKIPFKQIVVKDYRFDTTKFGYVTAWDGISGDNYKKITLGNSSSGRLTDIVNKYFSNNLDPSSQNSLIIYTKTLWLQKDAWDFLSDHKLRDRTFRTQNNSGACVADLDVFVLKNNKCTPLIKIKDNFFYAPYTSKEILSFLFLPFDSLIRKVGDLNVEDIISRKTKYELNYLDSAYSSRFDLPILKDIKSKKGIYVDFESFKHNRIAYPDFIIKHSKATDEIYILNGANEESLIDYWGYSDGKDLYIKTAFNCFRLVKQNNTWDVYGAKYVGIINKEDKQGIDLQSKRSRIEKRPLQLNMETGKVY